jgi:uncharacterized membrane protein YvlD (DUF360 family)
MLKGSVLVMSTHADSRTVPGILGYILRFFLVAVILIITSYFVPGFTITRIWSALAAAIVISLIDYVVEMAFGLDAAPFGKGIKGFVVAAIILFAAQYFVPNMVVTASGAIIAALVIGVLDAIIPGRVL